MASPIFLYTASAIFVAYVVTIFAKFGLLLSLSESHYKWKEVHKKLGFIFPLFILSLIVVLLPYWFDVSSEDTRFCAFLSLCGLLFVAGAPLFKDKFQRRVHFCGASVSWLGANGWLFFNGFWEMPVAFMIIASIYTLIHRKSWLLWFELAGILSLLTILLINHIKTI